MEVADRARMAQMMAANARLNARNGNVANASAPGFAVRPAKAPATRATAASAYAAASRPKPASPPLPPGFSKLPIEVDELLPHLSNARELYSAKSAVARNAMQLYGTMVDVMDDDLDFDDSTMEEGMSVMEDEELEHEASVKGDGDQSEDGEASDGLQITDSGFEASA